MAINQRPALVLQKKVLIYFFRMSPFCLHKIVHVGELEFILNYTPIKQDC